MRTITSCRAFQLAKTTMSNTRYTLKNFQETGVKWMIDTELNTRYKGGILADDPGLGKTIQTAALLAGLPKNNTLIIVPTSVLHQWVNTLSEIFGRDQIYLHYGSRKCKSKADLIIKMSNKTICITSHGACFTPSAKKGSVTEIIERRNPNSIKTVLHTYMWDRVVVDEAHVLRNKSTKIHQAVSLLNWTRCNMWGLTGTPVQNSDRDIVALACFVGIPFDSHSGCDNSAIKHFVETYVMRRTKQILIDNNELDDYEIVNHQVPFTTPEEQEVYEFIERDAIREMVRMTDEIDDMDEFREAIICARAAWFSKTYSDS